MADTIHDGLPLPSPDGFTLNSLHFQRLFGILNSQLNGAVGLLGAGVISGWEVTAATGGGYNIAPGRGIALHSVYGNKYLETKSVTPAPPVIDGSPYLFARIQIAATLGQPDSRETGLPVFEWHDDDELDGALLLAELNDIGTVIDRRVELSILGLIARVAQLESDVGYTDDERAIGSVAERLAALNGTDGVAYDDSDLRNKIAALALLIAALQTSSGGDIQEVENPSDITNSTVMRMESFLVKQFPDYALATTTSLDEPRYAGYGQVLADGKTSPNIDGGGNAVVDTESNTIHG